MSNFKDYIELANEMINEGKKNQNDENNFEIKLTTNPNKSEDKKAINNKEEIIKKIEEIEEMRKKEEFYFFIKSNKEIKNIILSTKKYEPINKFLGLEKEFLIEKKRTNKGAPYIYKVIFSFTK
jgi:hypothetical protein